MSTYAGPATVVLADGTELPVNAQLHTTAPGGTAAWRGAVGSGSGEVLYHTLKARRATLRLPDGREGIFVPSVTVALGGRVLQLDGYGPAPF
jgi:hypothetical protein